MYNPQYTTRFGVILEAYLKGCGESMLKQFEDQVEMQTTLERIGMKVCVCVCVCVCVPWALDSVVLYSLGIIFVYKET